MDAKSKSKLNPNPVRHRYTDCNKTFSSKSSVKAHKRIHTGEKLFKCSLCDYFVTSMTSLEYHIRTTHTKERPFKCGHTNCPFTFAQNGDLKRHQLVHGKDDERSPLFQCPEPNCSFKTIHKTSIAQHLRTRHSTVKPFACGLCPYRTKTKGDLTIHQNSVHSMGRTFECPQLGCTYSCKRNGELTRHMTVHSCERPFACSFAECSHKSKTKNDLKRHEGIHRAEKLFKCSFCTYSSNSRFGLVRHTRVHTGKTPFPCHICSYRGKSKCKLTRHLKERHSDKKSNPSRKEKVNEGSRSQGQNSVRKVNHC